MLLLHCLTCLDMALTLSVLQAPNQRCQSLIRDNPPSSHNPSRTGASNGSRCKYDMTASPSLPEQPTSHSTIRIDHMTWQVVTCDQGLFCRLI
jgi:hypothetical protein